MQEENVIKNNMQTLMTIIFLLLWHESKMVNKNVPVLQWVLHSCCTSNSAVLLATTGKKS